MDKNQQPQTEWETQKQRMKTEAQSRQLDSLPTDTRNLAHPHKGPMRLGDFKTIVNAQCSLNCKHPVWRTRDKTDLRICQMTDDHLLNAERFVHEAVLRFRFALGEDLSIPHDPLAIMRPSVPDGMIASLHTWQELLEECERRAISDMKKTPRTEVYVDTEASVVEDLGEIINPTFELLE